MPPAPSRACSIALCGIALAGAAPSASAQLDGEAIYRDYTGLDWLSPWTGFALLCAYAVVLVGAAAWRLLRFDA